MTASLRSSALSEDGVHVIYKVKFLGVFKCENTPEISLLMETEFSSFGQPCVSHGYLQPGVQLISFRRCTLCWMLSDRGVWNLLHLRTTAAIKKLPLPRAELRTSNFCETNLIPKVSRCSFAAARLVWQMTSSCTWEKVLAHSLSTSTSGLVAQLWRDWWNTHRSSGTLSVPSTTTFPLLRKLKVVSIWDNGTIRANRLQRCALKSEKEMRWEGQGSLDTKVAREGDVTIVRWQDNGVVNVASTFTGVDEATTVRWWSESTNKHMKIPCPALRKEYDAFMGEVDKMNFLLFWYPISSRTKKWTIQQTYHFASFALANSWCKCFNGHLKRSIKITSKLERCWTCWASRTMLDWHWSRAISPASRNAVAQALTSNRASKKSTECWTVGHEWSLLRWAQLLASACHRHLHSAASSKAAPQGPVSAAEIMIAFMPSITSKFVCVSICFGKKQSLLINSVIHEFNKKMPSLYGNRLINQLIN